MFVCLGAYMYVKHMHAEACRAQKCGIPWNWSCKASYACWEVNSGPV